MGIFDTFIKKKAEKVQKNGNDNEMKRLINKDGIDFVAKRFAEIVNEKILSEDVAMQFILEEVEAASKGNDVSKEFALNSGFDNDDYKGAMDNSFEEVEGVAGAQEQLGNLSMLLYPNQDLMAEFRIKVVDNIMIKWKLGRYTSEIPQNTLWNVVEKLNKTNNQEPFYDMYIDVENYRSTINEADNDHLLHISILYAMKIAASALYLQGLFGNEEYQQIEDGFKFMKSITANSSGLPVGVKMEPNIEDKDFMENSLNMVLEFIKSYHDSIDKKLVLKMLSIMDNNERYCPKENDEAYKFEQLIYKYR